MTPRAILPVLAALSLLVGCATPTTQGQAALGTGRYVDAAGHFQQALAREPGGVTDLIGLGVARYKLGALDEAAAAFGEVLAHAPDLPTTRLYLGMIAMRRGRDDDAQEHLGRFLAAGPPPRLAAHVDRTLRLLRSGLAPNPEVREYVAASVEDGYQWAGEIAGAVQAASDAQLRGFAYDRIYLGARACRCRR